MQGSRSKTHALVRAVMAVVCVLLLLWNLSPAPSLAANAVDTTGVAEEQAQDAGGTAEDGRTDPAEEPLAEGSEGSGEKENAASSDSAPQEERDTVGAPGDGGTPSEEDPKTEEPVGQDAGGEDPAGQDAGGEDPAGQDAGGEDPAGQDATGEAKDSPSKAGDPKPETAPAKNEDAQQGGAAQDKRLAPSNAPSPGVRKAPDATTDDPDVPVLTLDANGGQFTDDNSSTKTYTGPAGTKVNLPGSTQATTSFQESTTGHAVDISRDDYVFLGWSCTKNAAVPDADLTIGSSYALTDQPTTLYAVWSGGSTSSGQFWTRNFKGTLTHAKSYYVIVQGTQSGGSYEILAEGQIASGQTLYYKFPADGNKVPSTLIIFAGPESGYLLTSWMDDTSGSQSNVSAVEGLEKASGTAESLINRTEAGRAKIQQLKHEGYLIAWGYTMSVSKDVSYKVEAQQPAADLSASRVGDNSNRSLKENEKTDIKLHVKPQQLRADLHPTLKSVTVTINGNEVTASLDPTPDADGTYTVTVSQYKVTSDDAGKGVLDITVKALFDYTYTLAGHNAQGATTVTSTVQNVEATKVTLVSLQDSLTYQGNGGATTSGQTSYQLTETNSEGKTVPVTAPTGDSVSVVENPFSRTGYKFVNWVDKVDGGTTYEAGSAYKLTEGDDVLYAQWEPISYTVAYDLNGATGDAPAAQTASYDSELTIAAAPTRRGYTFAGWNTSQDGGGTTYQPGATASNLTATDKDTVRLYARWNPIVTNVTVTTTTSGDFADPNRLFDYTVTYPQLAGKSIKVAIDGTESDVPFDASGVATIQLKSGQMAELKGVPISESDSSRLSVRATYPENYRAVSVQVGSGTPIKGDGASRADALLDENGASFAFVSECTLKPQVTGVDDGSSSPWPLMVGAMVAGLGALLAWCVFERRASGEEQ